MAYNRDRGETPLARRSNLDFYVDSGGVTGFPKIIKLVNIISINPGQKNIDLTEMWSRYIRGGSLFRIRDGYTSIPGLLGETKEKLMVSMVSVVYCGQTMSQLG